MTNLKQHILDKIYSIKFSNGIELISIISEIIIKNNNVGFSIDITNQNLDEADQIRALAKLKIKEIDIVDKVTIVFTSHKNNDIPLNKKKHKIDNVHKLLMITSCKGGVGKSTVTVMIAEGLASLGYKIGVIDADIYGPSIPQIFGIKEIPEIYENKMKPIISRNIKLNSIGFISNQYLAWRGPMTSKAIYQLLSLTNWGQLDYLIIDTPPGTGDIHLSIIDNYYVDGAIIVSTPQMVALVDVEKSINLYNKYNIKLLGIIENMSYFIDNNSNTVPIFTGNAGQKLSQKYNIPLIDQIPILPKISYHCDEGKELLSLYNLNIEQYLRNSF